MIIKLDYESDIPIYLQLRHQIVLGIGSGELAPGESLPTVRQLASDVGVNPMTVNKTYQLLKQEGFIVIDRRQGALVSQSIPESETFKAHLERHLMPYLSEAKARGLTEDETLDLVRKLYRQLKEDHHV